MYWTGSDRLFLEDIEVQSLAVDVADEIAGQQYDGYKALYKPLADAVAFNLVLLTTTNGWRVFADTQKHGISILYRVWVERLED